MTTQARAYGSAAPTSLLAPMQIARRAPGPTYVAMEILFCGVCHSDVHTARGEWPGTNYACVPGHEIVGRVTAVGAKVTKVKVGDIGATGCMVDSCRTCPSCQKGLEQFCLTGATFTYNSPRQASRRPHLRRLFLPHRRRRGLHPPRPAGPGPRRDRPPCSAQVSRPIRRFATGRSARARKSAWSASAASVTWA